ncbi:MAG TPA: TIR domain-containing protein [Bryobacteraceae bacterium]|nr:TIR domain-containing protein [Bryobacteraceae bacterium]
MARVCFFSFHYQRDVWRVNQVRNIANVVGCAAAGFQDASLWEEAKKKGDAAIKKLIDEALLGTTVTVVFIGAKTAGRTYINYEIEQSIKRGNGIIGVQIHHLKDKDGNTDTAGATPAKLTAHNAPIYKYTDHASLGQWIEKAAKAAGK